MPKQRGWYPIFLDLEGRIAVIVGAGAVAARKAEALARCGARVLVIAPMAGDEIRRQADRRSVEWQAKPFHEDDLEGAFLVIAATDDAAVNAAVAMACRRRKILVNVVDATELCEFIVPAVHESGSIQIAISTGGHSPALARRLRKDLQSMVGPEYGEINDLLGAMREPALASLPDDTARKHFFESLLDGGLLELLIEGKRAEAYGSLARICGEAGVPYPDDLPRPDRNF